MSNFLSDAEAELEIARAQFLPISHEERGRLDGITGPFSGPENETLYQGPTLDHCITRSHIRTVRPLPGPKIEGDYVDVVRIYFRHICQRAAIGRARTRAQARAPTPTCVVFEVNFYQRMVDSGGPNSAAVAVELAMAGCKGQAMLGFDYLFMPNFRDGHWVLLGVAPKQRFIFVIDSIFQQDPRWTAEVGGISSLVWQEIHQLNTPLTDWLLITPSYDQMDQIWQNRIYVTQRAFHGCQIITCTNGLCLAFGYPLLCYSNEQAENVDDIPTKRERMALELLSGGFVAPYNYQVLTVPDDRVPFKKQEDQSRVRVGFDLPPNCQQPEPQELPPSALTQRWMTGRRRVGAVSGRKRRVAAGRIAREAGEAPQLYVSGRKPGANFPNYPLYTGNTFPRQFSRSFFRAHVLFLSSKDRFAKYTKKELIGMCKKGKKMFHGYEAASRKSVKEFRKWMEQAEESQER